MSATWSRLQEVLGISPRKLEYSDIVQIEKERIPEDTNLEWKAERGSGEGYKTELAKDLAAMANTGGGVIVFGIAEAPETKYPIINDIQLIEQAEHQIRSAALSRVIPPIANIDLELLENPENVGYGVIVVTIPNSTDSPHFYEKNEVAIAPKRDGDRIVNLRASDIERAIRNKVASENATEESVNNLIRTILPKLDYETPNPMLGTPVAIWCVIAIRPTTPPPVGLGASEMPEAERAWKLANELERNALSTSRQLTFLGHWAYSYRPIRGFRKWVLRTAAFRERVSVTTNAPRAELYDNGSVVLACPIGYTKIFDGQERTVAHAGLIETTVLAAVCLTEAWHTVRHTTGAALIAAEFVKREGFSNPTYLLGKLPWGWNEEQGILPADMAVPVTEFEAVSLTTDTTQEAKDIAAELALGFINQFEYNSLEVLQ